MSQTTSRINCILKNKNNNARRVISIKERLLKQNNLYKKLSEKRNIKDAMRGFKDQIFQLK